MNTIVCKDCRRRFQGRIKDGRCPECKALGKRLNKLRKDPPARDEAGEREAALLARGRIVSSMMRG